MWTVKLDATSWGGVSDFYSALLGAIGAPDWHGRSIDALVDSLVFGGINTLRPPIEIIVCNVAKLTSPIKAEIELAAEAIRFARRERMAQGRDDVVVSLRLG
jgi:hypothetical protein